MTALQSLLTLAGITAGTWVPLGFIFRAAFRDRDLRPPEVLDVPLLHYDHIGLV